MYSSVVTNSISIWITWICLCAPVIFILLNHFLMFWSARMLDWISLWTSSIGLNKDYTGDVYFSQTRIYMSLTNLSRCLDLYEGSLLCTHCRMHLSHLHMFSNMLCTLSPLLECLWVWQTYLGLQQKKPKDDDHWICICFTQSY